MMYSDNSVKLKNEMRILRKEMNRLESRVSAWKVIALILTILLVLSLAR